MEYKLKRCVDKYRMLFGLPPHDGPSNFCRSDNYFGNSIERDFDSHVKKAALELIEKERHIRAVFKKEADKAVMKMLEDDSNEIT